MRAKTRDQLLKENAVLDDDMKAMRSYQENLRIRFSKVLQRPERELSADRMFGSHRESPTLQWEEIFFCVGQISAEKGYANMREELHHLRMENDKLYREIEKLKKEPV